ncbi:MAG: lutC [Streptosporangiaceae bacterium]|jgi:hypothetical protein|nr:lutC [Streptosporangiaceae bacterium]
MNEVLAELFITRLAEAGGVARLAGSLTEAYDVVRALVGGRAVLVHEHPGLAGLRTGGTVPADPWEAEVGVTGALAAAADTGTVALGAAPGTPRRTSVLPAVHVVVMPLSRLTPTYADLIDLLDDLDPKPSGMQLVTGPSRSGDIEMAMIQGMHGPREVHVILYPDAEQ